MESRRRNTTPRSTAQASSSPSVLNHRHVTAQTLFLTPMAIRDCIVSMLKSVLEKKHITTTPNKRSPHLSLSYRRWRVLTTHPKPTHWFSRFKNTYPEVTRVTPALIKPFVRGCTAVPTFPPIVLIVFPICPKFIFGTDKPIFENL